ncbi:unnamed protein product, partial [Allacma fusca]
FRIVACVGTTRKPMQL